MFGNKSEFLWPLVVLANVCAVFHLFQNASSYESYRWDWPLVLSERFDFADSSGWVSRSRKA